MPITIHQLALHRLDRPADATLSGADYHDAGLAILGGCECCGATLAGYNGHPSRTGYWRCADCIGDLGWATVEEANADIFGTVSPDQAKGGSQASEAVS